MFFPPNINKRDRGFTLIELLVVITIIAVLVGLLFPVGNAVMNNSRKTQASADMSRVITSVISYQTDYGRLPVNINQQKAVVNEGSDTVYGDHAGHDGRYSNAVLFDALRAIPSEGGNPDDVVPNPRQVVYMQGENAKNATQPRAGFATQDAKNSNGSLKKGGLIDPWGNEYVVWIDANTDNDLTTAVGWFFSSEYGQGAGTAKSPTVTGSVTCLSMGPDGMWGNKANYVLKGSDDIMTW